MLSVQCVLIAPLRRRRRKKRAGVMDRCGYLSSLSLQRQLLQLLQDVVLTAGDKTGFIHQRRRTSAGVFPQKQQLDGDVFTR